MKPRLLIPLVRSKESLIRGSERLKDGDRNLERESSERNKMYKMNMKVTRVSPLHGSHKGVFKIHTHTKFTIMPILVNAYVTMLVRSENQANKTAGPEETNHCAGTQDNIDARNYEMEANPAQDYFVLLICSSYTLTVKSSKAKNEGENPTKDNGTKTNEEPVYQEDQAFLE
ncbi:hypothetical protein Tco_1449332 [Tanacetum coccineum]